MYNTKISHQLSSTNLSASSLAACSGQVWLNKKFTHATMVILQKLRDGRYIKDRHRRYNLIRVVFRHLGTKPNMWACFRRRTKYLPLVVGRAHYSPDYDTLTCSVMGPLNLADPGKMKSMSSHFYKKNQEFLHDLWSLQVLMDHSIKNQT